jgi:hypothetical protein
MHIHGVPPHNYSDCSTSTSTTTTTTISRSELLLVRLMDNGDQDDGSRMDRIRATMDSCGQDSALSDDDDEEARFISLEPPSHSQRLSQQGFPQDMSQPTTTTNNNLPYYRQPSVPYYPMPQGTSAELAAVHATWSRYAQTSALAAAGPTGAGYQNDPTCPFAAGGPMALAAIARAKPPLAPAPSSRAPSRAPSPAIRTASPSISATGSTTLTAKKKAAPKKKTAEDKEEEEKLQQDIDHVVNNFRPEYRDSGLHCLRGRTRHKELGGPGILQLCPLVEGEQANSSQA